MKSAHGGIRIGIISLLVCVPFTFLTVRAQQPPAKPPEREKLIAAAREIIAAVRYCALITRDARGNTQARTVDPFPPDENMVIWLATNPRSRKVREIRRSPRVTLYYFDREAQAYVTLHGLARLVNDPAEKAKRWKPEWKDFYPDRTRDYLLIVVQPLKLEVINVSKGLLGDPKTWKPPSVKFAASGGGISKEYKAKTRRPRRNTVAGTADSNSRNSHAVPQVGVGVSQSPVPELLLTIIAFPPYINLPTRNLTN